ncbi:MFS transporter [Actinacidiphila sp. bgisy144]|uniref:MFS transporter n=1 Tax=Actinacidiphila sp. bgisy144 TaxID=3413791 RepID=UPI003EBB26FD
MNPPETVPAVSSSPSDRVAAIEKPLLVPVLAALATVYTVLESMLGPAVPLIESSLHTTTAAGTWVFTGLTLAGIVSTPLVTRLADVRNKRSLLLAVWTIATVGVLVGSVAPDIQTLAVGQVLQGVGLTTIPLSIAIFRESLPDERLKRANGVIIGATSVGSAIGFLLAGPVTDSWDFRWLYRLPLIVLVVLLLAAFKVVPSIPARRREPVDVAGAALLGVSLTTLLVGLTLAPTHGWTSALFVLCAAAAAVLFAAFVGWERRTAHPLVDLRLGGRVVLTVCAISFAVGWANMTLFVAVPLIAEVPKATGYGLGGTATLAGWLLLPMGALGAVAAGVTHHVRRTVGARGTMIASGLLLLGSMLVLTLSLALPALIVVTVMMGAGLGLGLTEALNLLAEHVPGDRVASASGLVFMVRNTGSTFGAQVGGSILASSLLVGLPVASRHGMEIMSAVALAVAAVAALGAVTLPRARRG